MKKLIAVMFAALLFAGCATCKDHGNTTKKSAEKAFDSMEMERK